MDPAGEIIHTEIQTRKPIIVWPIGATVAALAWWGFLEQIILGRPWGNIPASDALIWVIWVLLGLVFPAFLCSLRLRIDVSPATVIVRYRPIWVKRFSTAEIADAEPVKFHPLIEWGGWGIRWRPNHGWAYTLSGNTGVRLTFHDGRRVLLGTRDPDSLADAIRRCIQSDA